MATADAIRHELLGRCAHHEDRHCAHIRQLAKGIGKCSPGAPVVGARQRSRKLHCQANLVTRADRFRHIINLSLGHPIYEKPDTDPLVRAVEDAVRAGIVVVAAAGNYGLNQETGQIGYAGVTSPGHRLVAVGAYGGSLYQRYAERRVFGRDHKRARYFRLSGTSMASAVTSGVVALVLEANRTHYGAPLSPNEVKAILEYTSIPLYSADPLSQGSGGLNGGGAVQLAELIDPGHAVGDWWLNGPLISWTFIDGQSFVWSQTVVWGNTVVWGTALLQNQLAWGQTVVWAQPSCGAPRLCGAPAISCGTTQHCGVRRWSGVPASLAHPAAARWGRAPLCGGRWFSSGQDDGSLAEPG
jgi:hypothetical protein